MTTIVLLVLTFGCMAAAIGFGFAVALHDLAIITMKPSWLERYEVINKWLTIAAHVFGVLAILSMTVF